MVLCSSFLYLEIFVNHLLKLSIKFHFSLCSSKLSSFLWKWHIFVYFQLSWIRKDATLDQSSSVFYLLLKMVKMKRICILLVPRNLRFEFFLGSFALVAFQGIQNKSRTTIELIWLDYKLLYLIQWTHFPWLDFGQLFKSIHLQEMGNHIHIVGNSIGYSLKKE